MSLQATGCLLENIIYQLASAESFSPVSWELIDVVNDTSRRRQVNARLEQRAHDVVRAIAFVDGTSEAEVVRQAVDDLVTRRGNEDDIQDALRIVAKRRDREDGAR